MKKISSFPLFVLALILLQACGSGETPPEGLDPNIDPTTYGPDAPPPPAAPKVERPVSACIGSLKNAFDPIKKASEKLENQFFDLEGKSTYTGLFGRNAAKSASDIFLAIGHFEEPEADKVIKEKPITYKIEGGSVEYQTVGDKIALSFNIKGSSMYFPANGELTNNCNIGWIKYYRDSAKTELIKEIDWELREDGSMQFNRASTGDFPLTTSFDKSADGVLKIVGDEKYMGEVVGSFSTVINADGTGTYDAKVVGESPEKFSHKF